MKALTYSIMLKQPVLTGDAGSGDPNTLESLDYLPGGAIRGALIARFLKTNPVDAADPEFRSLFLDGTTRFLNAYPLLNEKFRALPSPFSWRTEKGIESPIYDFAVEVPEKAGPWTKKIGGFCYFFDDGSEQVFKITPRTQINIHIARSDRQKVTSGSQVFRYVALSSGQIFGGAILANDLKVLQQLKDLIEANPTLFIGHSRMSGYGDVTIRVNDITENWQEYSPAGESEKLIVTCLSDVLLRNSHTGSYSCTLDEILGQQAEASFAQSRIISGFNRHWNLPLPQAQAISAGSVFVYSDTPELKKKLEEYVISGIGERLAEGFGRLALNWQCISEIKRFSDTIDNSSVKIMLSSADSDLAQRMVQRMALNKIEPKLIGAINTVTFLNKLPSKAQLSHLRTTLLREAQKQKSLKPVSDMITQMRAPAKKQIELFRVNGKKFQDWIEEFINTPQSIWNILDVDVEKLPDIGNVRANVSLLTFEVTIRYVEGVLHKAQQASEEAKNG